jgi:hypothetical protein
MKTCFATVATAKYIQYAQVGLHSIKENSGFDIPCYVFCIDQTGADGTEEKSFTDTHTINDKMDDLRILYGDKLIFQKIDYHTYVSRGKKTPHYWSHEAFHLKEYDRVIFFDVDIICLKSLTDLPEVDLGMTWEVPRNQWYAGFFVIGKKYITDETYGGVLTHTQNPKTWGHDQAVYNEYFKKEQVTKLDLKYNMVTPARGKPALNLENVRLLHYIFKPDSTGGLKRLPDNLYRKWYDYLAYTNKIIKEAK